MRKRSRLSRFFDRRFTLASLVAICVLAGCAPQVPASQLAVSITSPTPDPARLRDARVAEIYAAAKRRDETALLAMRDAGARAKATPDPALAFALLTIDPARYRDDFIAAYPQTFDGVNGDYGYRLVQAHLAAKGALVPIKRLGGFAAAGDAQARERLLSALPHAAGGIGEAYATEAVHDLFAVPPGVALDGLASLPSDVRLAAISEVAWCQRRPDRILSYVPTPAPAPTNAGITSATAAASPTPNPDVVVQAQIRQSLRTCERVAVVRPRRRPSSRSHRRNSTPHRAQPRGPSRLHRAAQARLKGRH